MLVPHGRQISEKARVVVQALFISAGTVVMKAVDLPARDVQAHRRFFFSGRSRHTRSKRDWSADVCSSDLDTVRALNLPDVREKLAGQGFDVIAGTRSEERRVGKECRSRWSPYR